MPDRSSILKLINPGDTVVEVGVWKGDFSQELLSQNPGTLHLVDPWKTFKLGNSRWYSIDQEKMDKIYLDVVARFKDEPRIEIHRVSSLEVKFPTPIDLVYVDGDHSYEAVKNDIEHWWPMIKTGGWLTGDDWNWKDKDDPTRQGPKPAVNEFILKHGLKVNLGNNQWWIQKV